jgi:hypothetical protein
MATLFRPDPEEEEQEEGEVYDDGQFLPEVPQFAVIVSNVSINGWHMAAVVGESSNPDFFVRALTVRWPYLVARPARSNKATDKPVNPASMSPTGTTPARKLVVNWGWRKVDDSVSQLRFFVRRKAPIAFRSTSRLTVRLTLKESSWPRRRIVVKMKSNTVTWDPTDPDTETADEETESDEIS